MNSSTLCDVRLIAAFFILTLPIGAQAEQAFVHGSWVNLRAAPAANAAVRTQLTTNTKVELVKRQDAWCSVKLASGMEGFLPCNLIGAAPLTLEQAAGNPGRAFWIAPSVDRLIAYGDLLRTGATYKRMLADLKDDEVARIPPLAEFDAAKSRIRAGLVPEVDAEVLLAAPVKPEEMKYAKALRPKPIRPSLFKARTDVILASEGEAASVAAVAGSRLALNVVAPPKGYILRHEGPELSGITGFGDVGEAELQFNPPLTVYSILNGGLVAAAQVPKQRQVGLPGEANCGKYYTGRSFGTPLWNDQEKWPTTPIKGFAKWNETTEPLVSFVTAKPFAARKVKIVSRLARITDFVDRNSTDAPKGPAKVVLHEIDLDNDGVADLLVWEEPSFGALSGEFNVARSWYVNIKGSWFAAGAMDDQECT